MPVAPKVVMTATAALVSVVASAALMGACSSSKPAASVSTTAPAPSTTGPAGTTPTPGSPTAPTTAGPSAPPTTLFAPGPVPAVTGAATLSKEPTIAAGSGAPPSKLVGKDLVVGTGATAGPAGSVTVQYVGALWTDGKVFDASWTDQGPVSFQLGGVIPGFKDAIIGMRIGGRREIVIPPAFGYGASGQPPTIPPNATLVFVIDLLSVQQ